MSTYQERERCWPTHKRRRPWNSCPLCNAPISWVRLDDDLWCPCDDEPVLFTKAPSGRYRLVSKREIVNGELYKRGSSGLPRYGRLPHYYSCPVLKAERRQWARQQRGW